MRISDWSSDVCSSDLHVEKDERERNPEATPGYSPVAAGSRTEISWLRKSGRITVGNLWEFVPYNDPITIGMASPALVNQALVLNGQLLSATSQQQRAAVLAAIKSLYQMTFVSSESRSEEHTSELQSLMRISYAVFCLKQKNYNSHYV